MKDKITPDLFDDAVAGPAEPSSADATPKSTAPMPESAAAESGSEGGGGSGNGTTLETQPVPLETKAAEPPEPPEPPSLEIIPLPDGRLPLGAYAEQAYLAYAMSVVKGRALPQVEDGEKPVQRRILFSMKRMGLDDKTKPVKSARVVGDVIGKLHPHGDSSVYDAMVRMAQGFTLRYPLIDGQGNFGSRDGDSAAAMRYTEARLTPFADLLLGEIDQGTVDFIPNYDGAFEEPALLPARLPMLLLNGASGIAVGMATEIPSHNLTEVAEACQHLIDHPEASLADVMVKLPGPDFCGGGQLISSPSEIASVYAGGRGSLRLRARWTVEPLARGQWQVAVTELPPGTSTRKVLTEIEALTNPQLKAGKKALTQEQANLKALVLSVVDGVRDDSDAQHPVRIIIEPRSSRQPPDEMMQVLLAHTSLESNVSVNLVTIGRNGRPQQKGLLQVLHEWIDFRFETVTRRCRHRLAQVEQRIHILEGRMIAFLNIDEVIRVIREADDPKKDLMARFSLTETQAEDILEIRLRQLARLEGIKIERELADLQAEQGKLNKLLDSRPAMTRQILKEIEADKKKFGDARRTLIQAAEKVTLSAVAPTTDDPVTVIVSKNGWFRARTGHGLDLSALAFKAGDELLAKMETRTSRTLAVLDSNGRCYNVSVAQVPTGRGDGAPLTSLIELQPGGKLHQVLALEAEADYLVASSGGYGFVCKAADLLTRQKAGKTFLSLETGELPLAPVKTKGPVVAVTCSAGRLSLFPLADVKVMAKGKGVKLMDIVQGTELAAITTGDGTAVTLVDKDGKTVEVSGKSLEKYRQPRGHKGWSLPGKMKAVGFV